MALSHSVGKIPTPGIKTPSVRKSPTATPSAKPASGKQIAKAESALKSMKASGNIAKDKAAIAKKTGVWPNGATN